MEVHKLVRLVEKLVQRKDIEYKHADVDAFEDICTFFTHIEGRWAGQPFKLNMEERYVAACVLGLKIYSKKEKRWLRYFRELNIFVARKWGKTLFMSALVVFLLCFDKEGGAFGTCLAENKRQARKLYDNVIHHAMVPTFRGRLKERPYENERALFFDKLNAMFTYESGRAVGKDGANPHFIVVDEAHEITKIALYTAYKTAMGARSQPLMIVISSAGVIPDSLYEFCYDRDIEILEKTKFDDHDRIFPLIFKIGDMDKVDDTSCWIKANPGTTEDRPSMEFLLQQYAAMKGKPETLNAFIAKHLNRQVNSVMTYYDLPALKRAATVFTQNDYYDTYATGGVDLAEKTDLCSATCLIPKNGTFKILQAYFIAEERLEMNSERDKVNYRQFEFCGSQDELCSRLLIVTPGSFVSGKSVLDWFKYLRDEQAVSFFKIGYDPWHAKDFEEDMISEGFSHETLERDRETKIVLRDDGILTEVRQGVQTLSEPIKIVKSLFDDNKIKYDKFNKLLPYCFYNLRLRPDINNNLQPDRAKSTGHIDGFMSLIGAYVAYQRSKHLFDRFQP